MDDKYTKKYECQYHNTVHDGSKCWVLKYFKQ